MNYKILLLDDNKAFAVSLQGGLAPHGLEVICKTDLDNYLYFIRKNTPDLILLDVMWPTIDGTLVNRGKDVLKTITQKYSNIPVVMLTTTITNADIFNPEDYPGSAFPYGKDSFIQNPEKAFDYFARKLKDLFQPKDYSRERFNFIVGNTEAMWKVCDLINTASQYNYPVLITGENGTGKEKVAEAIHKIGRAGNPFKKVECTSLPSELIESELFGHVKGSFTGAIRDKVGLFQLADNGTIFLDEIGEISVDTQSKLLRALQDKTIRRVGDTNDISIRNVRVIAATNKNLTTLVNQNKFRIDLFYRLEQFHIDLPPLRDRMEDIEKLYQFAIEEYNCENNAFKSESIRKDVLQKLKEYDWPGNIRQLVNCIKIAAAKTHSSMIFVHDIENALKQDEECNLSQDRVRQMVEEVIQGHPSWKYIKDNYKGEIRRTILLRLIDQYEVQNSRPPKSKELAQILDIRHSNLRRILSDNAIKLKDMD